jgi:TonB family protein
MSAQPSTEFAEPPIWSGWQNAVINGVYPLHRLVQGSQHSAIFLTERKGQAIADAALKIIPIERVTLAQLSHWKAAVGLTHPHLIQLFDAGLCQLGGRQFLFVVMEYAQETLTEVLGQRTLTAEEVGGLLPPTLKALTFLHRQGLVLGHLKPANVLVVDDQLKLASDSIRPAGAPRVGVAEPSFYDAPEANHAPFSSADDIWGLGVTLVEALTQHLPWPDEQLGAVGLPDAVPAAFVDTVHRCLNYDPAARPSAADLEAGMGGAPEAAPQASVPEPVALEAPLPVVPIEESPGQRGRMPAFVAGACLLLLVGILAALRLFHSHPLSQQSPSVTAPAPALPPAAAPSPVVAQNPAVSRPAPAVIHEQRPDVSRSALSTIHGRVKVAVLAVVDRTGAVVAVRLKNSGPSSYFAERAREAARKWRFAPTDGQGTHDWLLRFEFTRGGVTYGATAGS